MKKSIIVLLIAVLVAGFAFADFSGDAYIQFNADLDEKEFGFYNGSDVAFSFEYTSEKIALAGENDIHVEVGANATLLLETDTASGTNTVVYGSAAKSDLYIGDVTVGAIFKISKARIAGEKWYVDILGPVSSAYDYAKAASLTAYTKKVRDSFNNVAYYTTEAASYKTSYTAYGNGATIGYDGFVASFGFSKDDEGTRFSGTVQTKEFKFSEDAVAVQAAAEVSKKAASAINAGASVKASVAVQDITVKLAADFGFENLRSHDDTDPVFGFDARADFAYDFVEVNVYGASKKGEFLTYGGNSSGAGTKKYSDLYLEAKATFDLNSFELPLKVTLYGRNIIDKSEAGIVLGGSVKYTQDAITAGVSGSFNTEAKSWSGNVYGSYAAEKFTAGANVKFGSASGSEFDTLKLGAFIESDAIVEGATFGLNYGLNNTYAMYYGGDYVTSNSVNTNNLIGEEPVVGTIGCYCFIGF